MAPSKYNIVCAWCSRGYDRNPRLPSGAISHGICDKCEQGMIEEVEASDLPQDVYALRDIEDEHGNR